MGRCGSCRTQTQHFCFVHQEFVCDTCLTSKESIHGRCVVSTYREWVQDSSYEWPPKCPACNEELKITDELIRRRCLHVEHARCVEKSVAPDHACARCNEPLQKSFDGSKLGDATLERVRQMKALQGILPASPTPEEAGVPQMGVTGPTVAPLKDGFHRPNATLQIIETEVGTNVSQVASNDYRNNQHHPIQLNTASAPRPPPMQTKRPAPSIPAPSIQKAPETRIDMGIPPLKAKSGNSGSYNKREKLTSRVVTTSWRKTLKAGSRRLVDIRKVLRENRGRALIAISFLVCIFMVVYLSSGEDDSAVASRPVVEDVSLPHIRVNPAFIKGPSDQGIAQFHDKAR